MTEFQGQARLYPRCLFHRNSQIEAFSSQQCEVRSWGLTCSATQEASLVRGALWPRAWLRHSAGLRRNLGAAGQRDLRGGQGLACKLRGLSRGR